MKIGMNSEIRTFPELLEQIRAVYGRREAIQTENTVYSYGEMVSRVARRVEFIRSLNVKPGTRLGIICTNTADNAEWLLAIPAAGMTAVMLPADENAAVFSDICRRMEVAGVFGIDWAIDSIGEREAVWTDVNPETVAAVFLTSGTMGQPKGVVHTHGSLMKSMYNGASGVNELLFCRTALLLPMHHIFGAMTVLIYFISGALVYMDGNLQRTVLKLPEFKPTFLSSVPGILKMLLELSEIHGTDYLENVKTVACGGAIVPEKMVRQYTERGIRFLIGYGMTETGGFTSINMDAADRPESVGKIYPGQEARIEGGELLIRGENVMNCYCNNQQETAAVMTDGWLRTGDLACFDRDGFLYITGRKKKLIILDNGENVSPDELEHLLLQYPEVSSCRVIEMTVAGNAAVGAEIVPDAKMAECRDSAELRRLIGAVVRAVNAGLPEYKKIRTWKLVNEGSVNSCWKN